MPEEVDVLIVGSGAAAVHAAKPILKAGRKVIMLEAGDKLSETPPEGDILSLIGNNKTFEKGFGGDVSKISGNRDTSPKLLTSMGREVATSAKLYSKIDLRNYKLYRSANLGGLAELWGASTTAFSNEEITRLGFPVHEMRKAYAEIADEIGVSGLSDELGKFHGDWFNLEQPTNLSPHLKHVLKRHKESLSSQEFALGVARNAVITSRTTLRQECNHCGLCLYGCSRKSIYSPTQTLQSLLDNPNFTLRTNTEVVDVVSKQEGGAFVKGKNKKIYAAKIVILAAGTINSTVLTAKLLNINSVCVDLINNPASALAFLLPRFVGRGLQDAEFALAQLAYTMPTRSRNESVTGSFYSASTIPMQYFAREMPFTRKASLKISRYLSSGLILSNLFLPGSFSKNCFSLNFSNGNKFSITGEWTKTAIEESNFQKRRLTKFMRSLGAYYIPKSFTLSTPGSDAHVAGTISINDSSSLTCTTNCELKGKRDIYVVDGSVISPLPAKHLTFTIMANARRVGRHVVKM